MPAKRKWTQAEIAEEVARFDWSRIDSMSDEEIDAAAVADPESFVPTQEELKAAVEARAERLNKPAAE